MLQKNTSFKAFAIFLMLSVLFLGRVWLCVYEPVPLDYYEDDARIKGGVKPTKPFLEVNNTEPHSYEFIWTESVDPDRNSTDPAVDDYFLYAYFRDDIRDFYNKEKYMFWHCREDHDYDQDEEYCDIHACILFSPKKCSKILNHPAEQGKLKLGVRFYNISDMSVYFSVTAYDGARESLHSNIVKVDL